MLRDVAPMLLALICLLSGMLHQLRDLQLKATTLQPTVFELIAQNADTAGKIDICAKVIAAYDASDSFSVTTPGQMSVPALIQLSWVSIRQWRAPYTDTVPEIEIPPPRYLI